MEGGSVWVKGQEEGKMERGGMVKERVNRGQGGFMEERKREERRAGLERGRWRGGKKDG